MKEKMKFDNPEYIKDPEAKANRYAIRGMTTAIALIFIVWVLNTLGIFIVNQYIITKATAIVLLVYAIGMLFFWNVDLRKSWVKYIIIYWAFCIITVLMTYLTFHASIISVLLIVYCSMYSDKRIMVVAYILTVISISISVLVGYYFGLCDANMALLSGEPLVDYLGPNGEFLLTKLNENVLGTLPLFFIVPRSLICFCIAVICSKVSYIIRENIEYAHEMEKMAEIDEMTGIYNRNKYLSMTSEGYTKEDKLAVIFWDINYLKKINDTMGHEQGDLLIKAIGSAIRKISDQFDNAYRIGGDEFVMIMRGGDEERALKKLKEWEEEIAKLDNIENIPITASYGYACGKGTDLEKLIHEADKNMYINKHTFHAARND